MQTLTQRRSVPVDAAKTAAIFGTLLLHASAAGGFAGAPGSFGWTSALFWNCLLRSAVPVFFLCSGALLLPPEKEVTVRRVWTKYIPRILAALLFWAAAYEGVELLRGWRAAGVLERTALRQAALNLVLFHHKNHLYYLHIILLVYAVLPLTRRLVVLTHEAPRHRPRTFVWLYLAGTALTFGLTLAASVKTGALYQVFLQGSAPGVCLQAAGLYGFCAARWQNRDRWPMAETVSKASFCIYLTHLFFLDFLAGRGLSAAARLGRAGAGGRGLRGRLSGVAGPPAGAGGENLSDLRRKLCCMPFAPRCPWPCWAWTSG